MEKRNLNIKIFFSFLIFLIIAIIIYNQTFFKELFKIKYQQSNAYTAIPEEIKTVNKTEINLVFVGDIMLDRGVKNSVYKNLSGDYEKLFENTQFLKDADIAFANLEGPVTDTGKNVGSKYSFQFEPKISKVLLDVGIDIVSIANNHAGDRSFEGFNNTLKNLEKTTVLFTGGGINHTNASMPTIIEKNGIKIGFLGFTDVGPEWLKATDTNAGILLANDPDFDNIILNAKKEVDHLIVSFHFGEEYKPHTKRQEYLAHRAIDNGASIVIGHHPHIAQDTEEYNGGYIFYSLGNFIFDQYFSEETMSGGLGEVVLNKNKIIKAKLNKIEMNKWFVPHKVEI